MKKILDLYLAFFKIGITTFGGGYAMLPVIQREIVEKRGYVTDEEVMDYYAVGQCTPGVIAVNTATFVGHKVGKTPGAIAATLGVISPPLIIITVIAAFIKNYAELPAVRHAFAGIKTAVCALIFCAVIKLFKSGVKDLPGVLIFLAVLAVGLFTNLSPVWFVLAAAIAGICIKCFKR
ncbi:MAG: chromate transporter [Clostridia bacterium]|nr:chromate transporter [Clostridia bacterium]